MKHALLGIVLVSLFGACAGGRQPSPSPGSAVLDVVATTTVFADLVKQVGGDRVAVHSLVPKGGEVHTFDPSPSDAAALTGARLLVMNGLGLDDWLMSLALDAGAANAPVLKLAENLDEVDYLAGDEGAAFNPHLWMNPVYAGIYADRIRLKLIEIDPAGQHTYDANSAAYDDTLAQLDDWARQQLDDIPPADRRVVSFHDAFPYFAAAYGIEVVDVVVDAPGQDPSAAEVARVIAAIRASGVTAILAEAQFSDELADAIAEETGAVVASALYTDSLGDAPVDTYVTALRHDVEQITAALR